MFDVTSRNRKVNGESSLAINLPYSDVGGYSTKGTVRLETSTNDASGTQVNTTMSSMAASPKAPVPTTPTTSTYVYHANTESNYQVYSCDTQSMTFSVFVI